LGGLYTGMEDDPDTIRDKALMKKFRQPKLESEGRLEEILQLVRTNKEALAFVLGLEWQDHTKQTELSLLFTSA
jgi:hypothetical protein